MAGIRADDDPRLEKTVKLLFLCPKTSFQEAMQAAKFTEEEIRIPCFQLCVRRFMHTNKKSPPVGIVSSEMAASTLTASPKTNLLNQRKCVVPPSRSSR